MRGNINHEKIVSMILYKKSILFECFQRDKFWYTCQFSIKNFSIISWHFFPESKMEFETKIIPFIVRFIFYIEFDVTYMLAEMVSLECRNFSCPLNISKYSLSFLYVLLTHKILWSKINSIEIGTYGQNFVGCYSEHTNKYRQTFTK